jgi:hypothetical protein
MPFTFVSLVIERCSLLVTFYMAKTQRRVGEKQVSFVAKRTIGETVGNHSLVE